MDTPTYVWLDELMVGWMDEQIRFENVQRNISNARRKVDGWNQWTDGRTDGWIDGQLNVSESMNKWPDGQMNGCLDGWMDY